MYGVPVGTRHGFRWGALALAAVVALVAVASDPADARSRRKRHHKPYSPPYADIVVDARTGKVLHQSNADALRHPASLTKIMTLYLLFEQLEAGRFKFDTAMEVSREASIQAPTKLGLKPGQTLEVEDAIKALVTKSANDVAVVVAEALAGSEEEFARMMTRKARALGMRRTVYRNASGLPNDEQLSTARDQALLGIAIQARFPRYYRYFSTARFVFRGDALRNHNKLLGRVDGVDGIKTGYTRASGFNLVTSVHRGGRHIVAVVLGGRSSGRRDARMRHLIETQIAEASTRGPAIRLAEVPMPKPEPAPTPPERPQLADAGSAPATLGPSRAADATAAIGSPPPGSKAPIKPVPVKTLAVKLVPPKRPAAAADAAPAQGQTEPVAEGDSAPTATRRHAKRGGWAIQVGAFEDEKEAKERLNSAQSKLPNLLESAEAYTERTKKGDKTYYRARFAGLDRAQARVACRRLKRNDIACMALKI